MRLVLAWVAIRGMSWRRCGDAGRQPGMLCLVRHKSVLREGAAGACGPPVVSGGQGLLQSCCALDDGACMHAVETKQGMAERLAVAEDRLARTMREDAMRSLAQAKAQLAQADFEILQLQVRCCASVLRVNAASGYMASDSAGILRKASCSLEHNWLHPAMHLPGSVYLWDAGGYDRWQHEQIFNGGQAIHGEKCKRCNAEVC